MDEVAARLATTAAFERQRMLTCELEVQLQNERRRRALIEDSVERAQTARKYGGPEAELRKRVRTLAKA